MIRKYELMVILDPAKTDAENTELLEAIDEVVRKYGGTPDKRDVWGKRRLAFPINKRNDGFYAVITFDAVSTSPVYSEVDRHCKYTDGIIRHLITQAVVGKSRGQAPARGEGGEDRPAYWTGGRGGRPPSEGRRFRDDRERAPQPEAPTAVIEPSESPAVENPAPEQPAE